MSFLMKKYILLILILTFNFTFAQTNPAIHQLINKVNPDSLYEFLNILTGEKPITLFAGSISIDSRYSFNVSNGYAAEYLYRKLSGYGYKTFRQDFSQNGQNIYAFHYGTEKPNQYVILCAHYDSMPSGNSAPGADDNGSGTAAVIEAARILKDFYPEYTIIFALWDQEEQGLLGSGYYAYQANERNDPIIAVINLDMIGYDSNNDGKMEIHTRDISSSLNLANRIKDLNSLYQINLSADIINPGTDRSDHASFWIYKYPAVLLIESFADFNPYYHKTSDTIEKINKTFFHKNTMLALAAAGDYAKVTADSATLSDLPFKYYLFQNYPNPFNSSTVIKYYVEKETYVKLAVYDILGNEVAVLVDKVQTPNFYDVPFDASKINGGLSSGIYFYTMYSGNYSNTKKMLFIK